MDLCPTCSESPQAKTLKAMLCKDAFHDCQKCNGTRCAHHQAADAASAEALSGVYGEWPYIGPRQTEDKSTRGL